MTRQRSDPKYRVDYEHRPPRKLLKFIKKMTTLDFETPIDRNTKQPLLPKSDSYLAIT